MLNDGFIFDNIRLLAVTFFELILICRKGPFMENKQAPTQTLDQALNRTDFGHFIATHKNTALIILVAFILGVIGFSIYKNKAEEKQEMALSEIYSFSQTKVANYLNGTLAKADFLAELDKLDPKTKKHSSLLAPMIDVVTKLKDEGDIANAIKVLEPLKANYSTSNYGYYLILANLSALYEDNNELDKAIASLEELTKSKVKIMEAKTYFDLGRIYKNKNDLNNARLNFNYVVTNFATSEFSKLAKIYMMELGETK